MKNIQYYLSGSSIDKDRITVTWMRVKWELRWKICVLISMCTHVCVCVCVYYGQIKGEEENERKNVYVYACEMRENEIAT